MRWFSPSSASVLLYSIAIANGFCADLRGENSLMSDLIVKGIPVADETLVVRLPSPTMSQGMSADDQRLAMNAIAGDTELERFTKKTIVSPFILKIGGVADLPDRGHVQQLDLWFVTHGTLKDIDNKKLFQELAVPTKSKVNGLIEEARPLTSEELTERKLQLIEQQGDSQISYGILRTNVLDKVYVTGITFTKGERFDDQLTMAFRLDHRFKDDMSLPARWYPLTENEVGEAKLGAASPYTVAAAYVQATPLKFAEEAILIEIHLVFSEPYGWFEGRNLLRSKLPPLVQDAVRTFRRKLSQ